MSETEKHRVAVTVFVTVKAIDFADAADIARIAVRQTLNPERKRLPVEISAQVRQEHIPVRVVDVVETDTAFGNGYLGVAATSKAYRERGVS